MSFKTNLGRPHVDPSADQCRMVDPHPPDCDCASCEMYIDVQCLEPCVGTVPEHGGVRVCCACAAEAERGGAAVAYRDGVRFVIVHPELGVFLGSKGVEDFWSKVNPRGRPAMATFRDRAAAEAVMALWPEHRRPSGWVLWPVIADYRILAGDPLNYATVTACVAAGLPGWDVS